jgi:hypothetical protein
MAIYAKSSVVELVCGFDNWKLEQMMEGHSPSIEEFLTDLEDQLERGEISMADVELAIADFHHCR